MTDQREPVDRAPTQSPPPPPDADDAVIAALAAAITAGSALTKIRELLQQLPGVTSDTVTFVLHRAIFVSLLKTDKQEPTDPILAAQRHHNIQRRAAYIVAAVHRMNTATQTDTPDTIHTAWHQELEYLSSHLQATHKRNASATDLSHRWENAGHPDLMGWLAIQDDRTSPECRDASGRNFNPTTVPTIGYPGSVHPHCRCVAVPAWDTDSRVEDLSGTYS